MVCWAKRNEIDAMKYDAFLDISDSELIEWIWSKTYCIIWSGEHFHFIIWDNVIIHPFVEISVVSHEIVAKITQEWEFAQIILFIY